MDILKRATGLPVSGSDEATVFIHKTIRDTERNMKSLGSIVAGYVRNQERLHRKTRKLAIVLKSFSETEAPSLATVLEGIADLINEKEDIHQASIQSINANSKEPLRLYPMICNRMKNEIRAMEDTVSKETKKRDTLDRILIKDAANRTRVSQAQLELKSAHQDVTNVSNNVLDSLLRFEGQKRADLRKSLGEMFRTEMNYHARALEILTEAHQLINEDMSDDMLDIEERCNFQSRAATAGYDYDEPVKSNPRGYASSPTKIKGTRERHSLDSSSRTPSPRKARYEDRYDDRPRSPSKARTPRVPTKDNVPDVVEPSSRTSSPLKAQAKSPKSPANSRRLNSPVKAIAERRSSSRPRTPKSAKTEEAEEEWNDEHENNVPATAVRQKGRKGIQYEEEVAARRAGWGRPTYVEAGDEENDRHSAEDDESDYTGSEDEEAEEEYPRSPTRRLSRRSATSMGRTNNW
ncbi:FAM92 protein-domain-containing protein [Gaertneriomyces semiglobifer]|nr:FAM92 protein-domain-containing protein [Gaertneriomyces semiglobifer]